MLSRYLRNRYTSHYADMTKYNLYRGNVKGYGRPLPFPPESFNLVILDGHLLYTRDFDARASHVLLITQLVIALDAVKEGGTLFIKLSRLASLPTASVLYLLDSICTSLETLKPRKLYGSRRSFYAVVRGVRRGESLDRWIGILHQMRQECVNGEASWDQLQLVYGRIITLRWLKENYIPRLIELGTPVWEVQKECLASVIRDKGTQEVESDEDKESQDEN